MYQRLPSWRECFIVHANYSVCRFKQLLIRYQIYILKILSIQIKDVMIDKFLNRNKSN